MIALIDCNNFYSSCETVFNPALEKKPVIVLSNNDGCAISRNEEARRLGIKMAQPAFMIKELICENDVQVFSSNYTLYGDMSRRIMEIINQFIPRTEIYSIDEIFGDLGFMKSKNLSVLGQEIRQSVKKNTGIPVTVGIGPTKTLAKMANRFAKKHNPENGVYCGSSKEALDKMLSVTEVGGIWGIGKQHQAFLQDNGFYTAMDLLNAPGDWIRKNLSVVGQRLIAELNGIQCLKWEETPSPKKNICTSRSFGKLVTKKKELKEAVAKFSSNCAEKLRAQNSCASKLQVFIQTNPHRPLDPQYFQSIILPLDVASNCTITLIRYALNGLDRIFQPGFLYQKAGVTVMDIVPSTAVQMSLFENDNRKNEKTLMNSIDQLNKLFGRDTVRYAVQDYGKRWKLKQENLSAAYTTNLVEVIKIKDSRL